MGWSLHQMNAKTVLQNNWTKKRMWRNLKVLRYTRRRLLYADGRRQLGGEPPMHSRSMVKTFYNKDIVSEWLLKSLGWWIANPWQTLMMAEEVPLGYVPVWPLPRCYELAGNKRWIQQWYTILIRAIWSLQRKLVFQKDWSTLRSSITLSVMKSRKEKVVLQYISP